MNFNLNFISLYVNKHYFTHKNYSNKTVFILIKNNKKVSFILYQIYQF